MNRFGSHTDSVEDVIRFVKSTGILATPFHQDSKLDCDTEIIYVFNRNVIDLYRECDLPNAKIMEWDWFDIKSKDNHALDQAVSKTPQLKDNAWPEIREESQRLFHVIASQVEDVIPPYEIEEIHGDIYGIMLERASGIRGTISQLLFSVYQCGGYPCGWSGMHPGGKLLVYSRQ